ncbi:unnamed protein product [Dovyalis caffra]|uniref:Uncharacterized protein n=1 Tax=Dovyalis caffra TaxID=77055 RepID=A0AAV1S360_9ROSI|nr:unnamed protein product [Dovyalis caffra]
MLPQPRRSGLDWLVPGPPVPTQELSLGILVKTLASWLLERRAQREAGFTEQRLPPSLGSGRITAQRAGPGLAKFWPARSKPGVEPWHLSEDLGVTVPRVEGTA